MSKGVWNMEEEVPDIMRGLMNNAFYAVTAVIHSGGDERGTLR